MAGIGFRIEKILSGNTYLDVIKAHLYSAVIFSGPWLLSILTLFCLGYFSPTNIDVYEIVFFKTSIIYVFGFSLIGVGFLHLSVTRYLSDKLYLKEEDALIPIFNTSLLLTMIVQTIVVSAYLSISEIAPIFKILIGMIFLAISSIWVIMIFLTALRDYVSITLSFCAGSLVTILGSVLLGNWFGLAGYFLGYLIGHLVIVSLLSSRVFLEFKSKKVFDWDLLVFLSKNKTLVLLGIFYNLAIWVDKIVLWFSHHAVKISDFLYSYPQYESAMFFAYLSIIPALTIFLIHIETDFYKKYNTYYTVILDKGTFSSILKAKKTMLLSLKQSIGFVTLCQGAVSLAAIVMAPQLAEIFKLKAMQVPLFRLAVVGAFLHSLLLIIILIILYFDFKKLAFKVSLAFLILNGVLTYITTHMDISFIGYGYLYACLISLIIAFYTLSYKISRLEYLTFALQPVAIHREEESF